jgi:pimeloyl-ACP methyl ester carboxylesterase
MARVLLSGAAVEYEEHGAGVPVVFSHGGSSDLRYWAPQRETFGARYRFVAYSRRKGDIPATTHVSDLSELVRRLGAGPVHLVGFSTAIALRAALDAPELLRTLTIVEPNVPWVLEDDAADAELLARWRAENERIRAEAEDDRELAAALWFDLVDNRGRGAFDRQPESLRRMWLDNFGRDRASTPPEPLTRDQLSTIRTPTLALAAQHGMPYSRRIVELVASYMPDCRFVDVPGVTHFMSYQAAAIFDRLVLEFLAEHP